jgi:hypothetical protein
LRVAIANIFTLIFTINFANANVAQMSLSLHVH